MFYPIAQSLLFRLDPEQAHRLSLQALVQGARCGLVKPGRAIEVAPCTVMGLAFPNPVGIAAGLDKNGEYLDGLAALGVGCIEVGTVTPRPQPGNPRPRIFRLPEHQALINRLGFNNRGVEALLEQLDRTHYRGRLGINIGKNFDTPLERASDDYRIAFQRVAPRADYVTVNISSPNTRDLRQLQQGDALRALLRVLKQEQAILADRSGRLVPIAVKIAPDLEDEALTELARTLIEAKIDAVIATNTTLEREPVAGHPRGTETGGLSGAPLHPRALAVVRHLARDLDGALPIIGVGGITRAIHAREFLQAGASLVQLYTGLIYRGPGLIQEILEHLAG